MATNRYPPSLEGTIPAFYGTELSVPFSMNRAVSKDEVAAIAIKIKTVQSNKYLLSQETTNFSLDSYCSAVFDLSDIKNALNVGQYYKVQLAYRFKDNILGYFSTLGVIKYTAEPTVTIDNLSNDSGKINTHRYNYIGCYRQEKDTSEKVYSYEFNLYDSDLNLIQTSGEKLHNSYNDTELYESYDVYDIEQDLDLNTTYYLEYKVTTLNGLAIASPRYKIMQKQSIKPEIKAILVPSLNYENGYVDLKLIGEKNELGIEYSATGKYRILRASNKDNFKTWNEILKFTLYGQKPSTWLWKDFTVEQGVIYRYALQQYNDKVSSNRLESTDLLVNFEHAYLYDGERQLKIKYNPKVASFKNTLLETKTNTIGSQFPFIFRNGTVKYKEFSINGLISCRSDEEFLFVTEDSLSNYDQSFNLTDNNIVIERNFKLDVLEWLNNGKPKIFRSPGEGNYIVRLLNVSLTPNDTLGRMLHTFAATATEIGEYSYKGLEEYGFIQTADPSTKQLRWETIKLDESGIGSKNNILNYKAVGLRFEGMVPGDRLTLSFSDGTSTEIIIGATGSYEIDISAGININAIRFSGSYDNINDSLSGVRHQGILTYAFYSDIRNRFSYIEDIGIYDIVLQQYIGENNIIEDIQDVKTQIQGFYFIRATKREVNDLYEKNGIFYADQNGNRFTDFQPYMIYRVHSGNEIKYYDPVNKLKYDNYEPYLYVNDEDFSHYMDLTETYVFATTQLQEIESLKMGNGLMLEISYQKQVVEYAVENNSNKYPKVTENKEQVNKYINLIHQALFNSLIVNEELVEKYRNEYRRYYKAYIEAVEAALKEEEAVQGDVAS